MDASAALGILLGIVVIASTIWVYTDAKTIGAKHDQLTGMANMDPGNWAVCCLLVWIIFFPYYLAKRPEIIKANQKEPHGR